MEKINLIAEILMLLGLVALVVTGYLINVVIGTLVLGIALLLTGYVLMKAHTLEKLKGGG